MKVLRVLIVDDEELLREMLQHNLMALGKYVIETANSGTDALIRLEKEKFDVIVTDIRMPKMSGIELLEATEGLRQDMEAIVLTGHAELENAVDSLRSGAHNFLQKPVRTEELHFAIQRAGEKLRLKRKLRESEARYRALFQGTNDGVAIYQAVNDGADFVFLDFNHAGEIIDNIDRKDLIGKSVSDVFPGIREMGLFDVLQRVYRTGTPEHLETSFYKDPRISGWRESYVYKLASEVIVTVYSDETERKRAEEKDIAKREKFRRIIDAINQGLLIVNRDFRVEFQNRVITERFGEQVGGNCYQIMGLDKMCPHCAIDRVFKTNTPVRFETIVADDRICEVNVFPFTDTDGENKIVCLTEDISDKKALQAETMRVGHLAAIGELAAGVAHEINNPISGIISLAEIMLDQCEEKCGDTDIPGRIIREGDRIAEIVKSLLSFAREKKEAQCPANLMDIINDSMGLVGRHLDKDGIRVQIGISPDLPAIRVRSQEIQQVFLNLFSNARFALNKKYAGFHPDKRIVIDAEMTPVEDSSVMRITFSDFGTGIPSGVKDKICHPFFSTKPKGVGTGLGLSISHGIIEAHGGRLRFESEENFFTKAIIEIPGKK